MKNKFWNILFLLVASLALSVMLHYTRRIFWFDQFLIPTSSMAPTMLAGDRILVDKTLLGPRIYRSFRFEEGAPFVCTRLKGRRVVKPNDIIVFNFPYGWKNRQIAFRLNRLYAKRCIGTPGDSVGVCNGWFFSNNYQGVIGNSDEQARFEAMNNMMIGERFLRPGWLQRVDTAWTIHDFGPIYVPASGETVRIDSVSLALYSEIIAFETGVQLDSTMEQYTFKYNWYFACGDNIANSNDSRHWGFIPEDFIVGIAIRISYSIDPGTGKLRTRRFMKSLVQ